MIEAKINGKKYGETEYLHILLTKDIGKKRNLSGRNLRDRTLSKWASYTDKDIAHALFLSKMHNELNDKEASSRPKLRDILWPVLSENVKFMKVRRLRNCSRLKETGDMTTKFSCSPGQLV